MGHLARRFTFYEMSLLFIRTCLPKRVETPSRKVDALSSSKQQHLISLTCSSSELLSYSGISSVSLIAAFLISSLHVSYPGYQRFFLRLDRNRKPRMKSLWHPLWYLLMASMIYGLFRLKHLPCLQISLVAFGR